ncbi:MAG: hypothetical protein RBT69_12820, partial [Spirochaetia bacterium]|nr:hypothetical protein [Spirochaetia bacterium]
MNLGQLKKFAQNTRLKLISQIESRLDYAVSHDDEYLRAHVKEKKIINERIKKYGREHVVEETAYIWFNRFTAIRYMDNRNYNSVRILSPSDGEVQPQIMAEIKGGRFPDQLLSVKNTINSYLDGRIASRDPDREIYKTALLAWCNHLGSIMPYMFSKVDDWAALLLPLDLLSPESVIADFQKNITPDDCADVEIIGWLY